MSNWPMVALGELIEPARARRAGDSDFPLLSMTMHEGLVLQSARFDKRIASRDTSTYKVVKRCQLVVGFPIDEGVLDFQDVCDEGIVSPAYQVWDIRAPEAVDAKYLGKYLKSEQALNYYSSKLRGSTARRRSLPQSVFLEMGVPLPPVNEQRRVASILDSATEIRSKRLESLQRINQLEVAILDALLQTRWDEVPLAQVAKTTSGGTPDRSNDSYYGGAIPWVKSGELHSGLITSTEESITEAGLSGSSAKIFRAGTVLIAMYGATAGVVGKLGIDAATNQAICAIFPTPDIEAEFLISVLRSRTSKLVSLKSGGAQPNLSQSTIRKFMVPLPPIGIQRDLVAKLGVIGDRATVVRNAARLEDKLFTSLHSRAFRGEL